MIKKKLFYRQIEIIYAIAGIRDKFKFGQSMSSLTSLIRLAVQIRRVAVESAAAR